MRFFRSLSLLLSVCASAQAQWQVLDAHTTADFRGVHYVGNGVAWVSGTNGTVLRTEDMGKTWTHCAVPPGAEKLDFRGVQAFDAKTAIVMSSGAGELSRLYKTSDGCATWKLVFTNPDKEGFFDAVQVPSDKFQISVLGDSVDGKARRFGIQWDGEDFSVLHSLDGPVPTGESSFAASNSVLQLVTTAKLDPKWKYHIRWAEGTPLRQSIAYIRSDWGGHCDLGRTVVRTTPHGTVVGSACDEQGMADVPLAGGTASSGIFSFAFRTDLSGIAVGGDYLKPDSRSRTAAYTEDGGVSWKLADESPGGYRSAVAWCPEGQFWISVGPNGTDVSRDDGRTWQPLRPQAKDGRDADRNWNALSLPFVVGPHGRIGLLGESALAGLSGGKDGARTPGTRK